MSFEVFIHSNYLTFVTSALPFAACEFFCLYFDLDFVDNVNAASWIDLIDWLKYLFIQKKIHLVHFTYFKEANMESTQGYCN